MATDPLPELSRLTAEKEYVPTSVGLSAGSEGADVTRLQRYLQKFGYTTPTTQVGVAPEGPTPGVFDETTVEALQRFQQFNGLPVTGELDAASLELMSRPRCGLPDHSVAGFAVEGSIWDHTHLTYAYQNFTPDVTDAAIRSAVSQAFSLWAAVVPLTFAEVALGGSPDIIIRFVAGAHGDGLDFDGPGGTLAHAFYPNVGLNGPLAGDAHFDEDEMWSVDLSGVDLVSVAAHEFGHSLGLLHSDVTSALMYPFVGVHRYLDADDVAGIQSLYGARPGPSNDNRSGAQLVPSTDYWGIVLGGVIDAATTEDAGGPVDGFGARDVFYYWSSLPAGNVYIYIQPRGGPAGAYFEAGTFSGSPTSWTSGDGFPDGFGSGGASTGTCRLQHWHTGGALSLVVYTYVGDSSGDTMSFDFGWGHDQDATSSHWGADQDDDYEERTDVAASTTRTVRGIKQTYTAMSAGLSVPPESLGTCAFENARDGVVDLPAATDYGCTYIGPGPGTTVSGLADLAQSVGTYYRATGVVSVPPAPTATGRSDRVGVEQSLLAWRYGDSFRGPITDEHSQQPDGFSTYRAANEGADDTLVWGWDFVDATPAWETRNYYLGDFTLSNTLSTGQDVQDPITVLLKALDASTAYADAGTVEDAADRIYTHYDGTTADAVNGYVTPAESSTGVTTATLTDLATTAVTIADGPTAESYLIASAADTDGNRWLVGLFVSQETLDDTPPTFGDPPRTGEFTTVGNRTLAVGGTPTFESRLPTWRPYLGFPIALGGWHVGRVGSGGSW